MQKLFLVFLLVLPSLSISIKSLKDKSKSWKFQPVSTEPITAEMCDHKEFKRMHICIAMKKNREKLKKLVEQNSCLFRQFTLVEMKSEDVAKRNLSEESQSQSHTSATAQRTINESSIKISSSSSSSSSFSSTLSSRHIIRKRSTAGGFLNPCEGPLTQVIVYEAADRNNRSAVYELVHDPDNHLYQTFHIRPCTSYTISNYVCSETEVIYKTLVYLHPPWVSDDVGTRSVLINGTCALMSST